MRKPAILLTALLAGAVGLSAQGRFPGGMRGGQGFGYGAMSGRLGAEERVTGAPYSGVRTTVTQQTLSNGNVISRQEQAQIYRDSQGRVRIEQTLTNTVTGKTRTTVTITDPVAGVSFLLNSQSKTYTRSPARMFFETGFARGRRLDADARSGTRAGRRAGAVPRRARSRRRPNADRGLRHAID